MEEHKHTTIMASSDKQATSNNMATEQREKLHKVLEFYQYDQKDYPVAITLQERSEADLVMLEYIMTSNTYKDDVEGFISDMAAYEFHQHLSLEEWYKDTMEMEDEEDEEECPDCCDKTQWIPRSTKCSEHWVCGDSGYCDKCGLILSEDDAFMSKELEAPHCEGCI